MKISTKIFLVSALLLTKVIVSACDLEPSTSSSSSSGSSGGTDSGSSTGSRGSCSTSNVCVYYFDMTSAKYTEISNSCSTATGWMDGTNACEGMIGGSRTQICQHTASDSKSKTYSYGHTQEGAISTQETCERTGGISDIINF